MSSDPSETDLTTTYVRPLPTPNDTCNQINGKEKEKKKDSGPILDLCPQLPETELVLHRGDTGLGLSFKGGTDIPYFEEDTGIFVTGLKVEGAVFRDKRISEGDKIVAVNGHDLRSVTHNEAVQVGLNVFLSICLLTYWFI